VVAYEDDRDGYDDDDDDNNNIYDIIDPFRQLSNSVKWMRG